MDPVEIGATLANSDILRVSSLSLERGIFNGVSYEGKKLHKVSISAKDDQPESHPLKYTLEDYHGTWEYTPGKGKIIFQTIIFRFKLLIFGGVYDGWLSIGWFLESLPWKTCFFLKHRWTSIHFGKTSQALEFRERIFQPMIFPPFFWCNFCESSTPRFLRTVKKTSLADHLSGCCLF